jgi:hypothetical protein
VLVDWPPSERFPSAIAMLTVRDAGSANKIVRALTPGWQTDTRNNVQYYRMPVADTNYIGANGPGSLLDPTIAVTPKLVIAGYNSANVDRAVSGGSGKSPLATTTTYREAARLVPNPQQMFVYFDLPTLYARLDAVLRPMLQMSAAFIPGLSQHLDAGKLPPVEVVTRHLSPVAASQSYVDGGYRSESAGCVTIGQAAILAGAGYLSWTFVHRSTNPARNAPSVASPSPLTVSPTPTP